MRGNTGLVIAQFVLLLILCGIAAALLLLPAELERRPFVVGAEPESAAEPEAIGSPDAALSAETVKEALRAREDLIPFDPVLGGTMGFYGEDDIHVLSERYVFARFTDGHRQGSMVLTYRIEPSGRIQWRVLSAALD